MYYRALIHLSVTASNINDAALRHHDFMETTAFEMFQAKFHQEGYWL
jgi:hypothetical protein